MGTAISTKTVCLPPPPMKNKLNIYRDVRPTMAVRKSEINLQFTKKNTFVTASFKKHQITLKTRWIFQDWKVTTFDQTCQHRAKSGSQEIWTHRFVHLGSKQCPTSIKFTFFFHILSAVTHVRIHPSVYFDHHSTHLVPSSTPTQLSPTVMILSWSTGPRRNSKYKVWYCCTEWCNWLQDPLNTIYLSLNLLVQWLWSMRNLPQHQYLLPPIEVQSQKRTASLKTTSPSSLFPNLFFGDYSVFWKSEFGKTRLSGSRETRWVCMLVVRLSDGK